jgi:hypothetical protein
VLDHLGIKIRCSTSPSARGGRAVNDDYFVERKLYPNVDFYSGIIYRAIGFPTDMFTVMFALGRLPGWIAHWKEMLTTRRPRSAARARSTPAACVAAASTAWCRPCSRLRTRRPRRSPRASKSR